MSIRLAKILVISLALFATSLAQAAQKSFDKRFTVKSGERLRLTTDIGSIAIVGRDTREVVVHVDMRGTEDFLERLKINAEQDSSGVTVTGHSDGAPWWNWLGSDNTHVEFTVDVPREYAVELKTSGGGLDVRNLNAAAHGKTSGGSIVVREISGSVDMRTSGGSITATQLKGDVQLSTSGGHIDIDGVTGDLDVHSSGGSIGLKNIDGRINAGTSGGSVRAELRGANRGISLSSSGGAITLRLPDNTRGSIDARTSGGRVDSEIPLSTPEITDHSHLRGALNGGGESILLHTWGGSIHIESLR